MVSLGDSTAGSFSQAYGVSADGSVVVGSTFGTTSQPEEAFRWTSETGMVGLDNLSINSAARAVTARGEVVIGLYATAESYPLSRLRRQTFRWTSDSELIALGFLVQTPGIFSDSTATDITPDGSVIVGASNMDGQGNLEAFLWTSYTGMVGLGHLLGGSNTSKAMAVSADGTVVAGTSSTESGFRAFVWDSENGMRNLQQMLIDVYGFGAELKGWRLLEARGLSADGTVITGRGMNPAGNLEAWVAVIPKQSR